MVGVRCPSVTGIYALSRSSLILLSCMAGIATSQTPQPTPAPQQTPGSPPPARRRPARRPRHKRRRHKRLRRNPRQRRRLQRRRRQLKRRRRKRLLPTPPAQTPTTQTPPAETPPARRRPAAPAPSRARSLFPEVTVTAPQRPPARPAPPRRCRRQHLPPAAPPATDHCPRATTALTPAGPTAAVTQPFAPLNTINTNQIQASQAKTLGGLFFTMPGATSAGLAPGAQRPVLRELTISACACRRTASTPMDPSTLARPTACRSIRWRSRKWGSCAGPTRCATACRRPAAP